MIGIALLSPLLFAGANICRYGGWDGFRAHHARMANACYWDAADRAREVNYLRMDARASRVRGSCRHQVDRPIYELIAEEKRLSEESLKRARWHEFLAFGHSEPELSP
ncbi:MAG TPA: hypothetical protein VGZ22_27610 [Isosphaeraceae bacterium]|jgi:hypothetical protein|nr:hypothetical protein [Isosphaeraceae bacterium]